MIVDELSLDYPEELDQVAWEELFSHLTLELPRAFRSALSATFWQNNYSPLLSQREFHDLREPYKGFSGPVGSGKSAALCREALRLAYANPGCPGLIGAPTYGMLADVTRAAFLEHLEAAEIRHQFRAARNLVYLPDCDVKIFFRSLSDPGKLVGKNLAWAGVDELTFCPQASWEKLEARLRHPMAKELCGFAAWTPRGFDWVYNRFKHPDKKLPGYGCIFATPRENHHVAKNGYYDRLKTSYDHRLYQQEVLGEYLNIFAGQSYYAFDRARNVKPLQYGWKLPVCWSMDFNVARMSSVIAQYVPKPGDQPAEIRVLDEIVLTNSHTAATCDEFLERLESLTCGTPMANCSVPVRVYGDASGESRTSKTDKTDYEIIRRWASRNKDRVSVSFFVPESNPTVRGRVAAMNSMLYNEAEEVRMLIDPRCLSLAEDLEQVGWAKDGNGNESGEFDKSNSALTHISDALGYLVHKEAGLRQRGGSRSRTTLRY